MNMIQKTVMAHNGMYSNVKYYYIQTDFRHIKMTRGEKYILLRVTNDEWWDVIHHDFQNNKEKKFYVPGTCVNLIGHSIIYSNLMTF